MQITDIFAECSIDYDPKSQVTKDFFATVQNKFHYAITGQTAAEIIDAKVNKSEPFMGLTTWKNYSFLLRYQIKLFFYKDNFHAGIYLQSFFFILYQTAR